MTIDEQYEKFKRWELSLDDIGYTQKVNFLIMLRTEKKTIEQLEEDIKSSLLEDTDFQKADVEWVTVMKKERPTVTLRKDVDKYLIRSLYPDICKSQNVLHQEKLSEKVWDYLKSQPEAVEEVITVDAKKLNEVTKEYTEQKITTYIEVKGL